MKRKYLLLLVFFLGGCASWKFSDKSSKLKNSRKSYKLQDISGKYRAIRDIRFKDNRTRFFSQFLIKEHGSNSDLEKTMAYSQVVKGRILPRVSRYETWLEKKKFTSQIKFSPTLNIYEVTMKSPEKKWNGSRKIKVPLEKYSCFLSQIPECILLSGMMERFKKDPDVEIDIVVIWDNYPFYSEQYLNLTEKFYSVGHLRIDGLQGDKLRLSLEVQNQIIFYTFNRKFEFQNIYWVAQGYRLERD